MWGAVVGPKHFRCVLLLQELKKYIRYLPCSYVMCLIQLRLVRELEHGRKDQDVGIYTKSRVCDLDSVWIKSAVDLCFLCFKSFLIHFFFLQDFKLSYRFPQITVVERNRGAKPT